MPIHAFQGLAAHPKEAGGLPHRNAALHQPSRARMAENVGSYVIQPSPAARRCETALYVPNSDSIVVDHKTKFSPAKSSPPQMRQEPVGNRDTCSSLVRASRSRRIKIDTSIVKINL
jgi:hypothetical protein